MGLFTDPNDDLPMEREKKDSFKRTSIHKSEIKENHMRTIIWKSPDLAATIIFSPEGEYYGDDKLNHYFLYINVPGYKHSEILSIGAETLTELGNEFRKQVSTFMTPTDNDWQITYYRATQYILGNLKKSERIIPEVKWNLDLLSVGITTIGEGSNLLDNAYVISIKSSDKEALVASDFTGVYSVSKNPSDEEKKALSDRVVENMKSVELYVFCVRTILSKVYTTLHDYFEDPAIHNRIYEIKENIRDRYAKLVSKLQSYLRPEGVLLDKYEEAVEQFNKENRNDLLELDKLIEPVVEDDNGFRLPPPPPEIPALKNL